VVLLVLGQYTPFPQFDIVRSGVVFDRVALTAVGTGMLFRSDCRYIIRLGTYFLALRPTDARGLGVERTAERTLYIQ